MVKLLSNHCMIGRKDDQLLFFSLGDRCSLWLRYVLRDLCGALLCLNHLLRRYLLWALLRDSLLLDALKGINRLTDIGLRLGLVNRLLLRNGLVDLRDDTSLLWRYPSLHVVIRNHYRRITSSWRHHLLLDLATWQAYSAWILRRISYLLGLRVRYL